MTVKIPKSARLKFAFVTKDDAEFLFELDQDPEVMRFITGGKLMTRAQLTDLILPRMAKYADIKKGWGLWRVTEIETDDDIGWIIIRPNLFFSDSPEFDNLEVGWRLAKRAWGKGYATEAAQAVLEQVTKPESVCRICAIADPDNQASINIMEKLGMKFVKRYMHLDAQLGEFDVVYYERLLDKN